MRLQSRKSSRVDSRQVSSPLVSYERNSASSSSCRMNTSCNYLASQYALYEAISPSPVLTTLQHNQRNVYIILESCPGGDLANYIEKRGRVDTLQYIPSPGACPQYYPHPESGGLDSIVVRSLTRQLGW